MVRTGNGGGLAARGVIFTQSELVVSGQGGNSNSWDDRAEREDSRTKYNLFETQRYWRPKSVACLNSLRPKLHSNRFYRLWSIWVEELLLLGQLRDRIQRGDRIFFSRVVIIGECLSWCLPARELAELTYWPQYVGGGWGGGTEDALGRSVTSVCPSVLSFVVFRLLNN